MSDKPRFWDFFWASHVGDSYLIIRDGKNGAEKVYYRIGGKKGTAAVLMLVVIAILIASLSIFDDIGIWFNLEYDLFIITSLIAFILIVLMLKHCYKSISFKQIHGQELQEILKKKKRFLRLRRVISVVFYVLLYGFLFINSYSVTYMRYLAEGGSAISAAEVSIILPDNRIELGEPGDWRQSFIAGGIDDKRGVVIKVYASKMPEDILLFLNGREIKSRPWKIGGFIWDDEYFNSETDFYITFGEFRGINTLEVKSGDFSKVWTFELEQQE